MLSADLLLWFASLIINQHVNFIANVFVGLLTFYNGKHPTARTVDVDLRGAACVHTRTVSYAGKARVRGWVT